MPGAGRVVATAAKNSETTISWVDETKSTVAKRGVGKCHAAPRRTRERSDADAAVLRISQSCDHDRRTGVDAGVIYEDSAVHSASGGSGDRV